MKTIELFSGHDYFTQRNNRFAPGIACQRTGMVQGLVCSEVEFDHPAGKQPEDYLFELGERPEIKAMKFRNYPKLAYRLNAKGETVERPNLEIHEILAYVTNSYLVKRRVVKFSTEWDLADIVYNLVKHRGAAVLSTSIFGGHVVAFVGIKTDQNDIEEVDEPQDIVPSLIRSVYLNDPNGDYRDGYKTQNGKGVLLPLGTFLQIARTENRLDKKFAHLIRKEGWA